MFIKFLQFKLSSTSGTQATGENDLHLILFGVLINVEWPGTKWYDNMGDSGMFILDLVLRVQLISTTSTNTNVFNTEMQTWPATRGKTKRIPIFKKTKACSYSRVKWKSILLFSPFFENNKKMKIILCILVVQS